MNTKLDDAVNNIKAVLYDIECIIGTDRFKKSLAEFEYIEDCLINNGAYADKEKVNGESDHS